MDGGRLSFASEHQAPSPVGLQVFRDGPRERRRGLPGPAPEDCADRLREDFDVAGAHRKAVVGRGPGHARRGLDGVEPVHPSSLAGAAARRELPDRAEVARPAGEEVGVQGEDDVRLRKVENGVHGLPERGSRPRPGVVPVGRLPLVPAGFGQFHQERPQLRAERG